MCFVCNKITLEVRQFGYRIGRYCDAIHIVNVYYIEGIEIEWFDSQESLLYLLEQNGFQIEIL